MLDEASRPFVGRPTYFRPLFIGLVLVVFTLGVARSGRSQDETSVHLRAGTSRADITPPAGAAFKMSGYGGRTRGFEGIHDRLFTRALVLHSGGTQAVIVVNDLLFTWDALWESTSRRIEAELGIPPHLILMAATHTHGGPALYREEDKRDARLIAYTDSVEARVVRTVRRAQASLEAAQLGDGIGRAGINVNRVARTVDGAWWIGRDPDGPSDKAVHVVKVERLDGRTMAVLINYAVHAVVMGADNLQLTGDVAGATARYVEEQLGEDVLVLWTSGAAGDQNPIYGPGGRFGHRIESIENLGRILGEEVIRVAQRIDASNHAVRIRGAQKVVTLPGKKTGSYEPDGTYHFEPADPVDLRLSLLMLDYVALAGVSGEVLTGIGLRLKKESPVAHTIMLTHTNGSDGYVPTDEAYERPSYEVVSGSEIMSGAEDAVVDGLLELIGEVAAPARE